jgi:hypothetical protein
MATPTCECISALPQGEKLNAIYCVLTSILSGGGLQAADIRQENTAFVDSVYGDDSTALVEYLSRPFATLEAARDAMLIFGNGLIVVRPGDYSISTSLATYGVNWHFENGARVSMVQDADGSIFDDLGGPVICTITGYGQFTRGVVTQAEDFANVIHITNSDSVFNIECETLTCECPDESANEGLPGTASIYHSNGSLTIDCRDINSIGYCYYWKVGPARIKAIEIISTANSGDDGDAIYCVPQSSDPDTVYVNAEVISAPKSAIYTSNAVNDGVNFYLGVTAKLIVGGTYGVQQTSAKVYVTAQKIAASTGHATILKGGGVSGTQLFVAAQKLGLEGVTSLNADFRVISCAGTKARIGVQDIDLSAATSGSVTGGLIDLIGATAANFIATGFCFAVPTARTESLVSVGSSMSGLMEFCSCRFDSSAPTTPAAPITVASSGLVLKNCEIVTAATNSITAGSALNVKIYNGTVTNKAKNANITIQVGTLTVDSNVG